MRAVTSPRIINIEMMEEEAEIIRSIIHTTIGGPLDGPRGAIEDLNDTLRLVGVGFNQRVLSSSDAKVTWADEAQDYGNPEDFS